jgi:xanthine/uracil/vitamin C permease (AzgA family)
MRQAGPAFLTMMLMPLTYSIAYGVIGGLGFAIGLWILDGVWETSKVCMPFMVKK